MSLPQSNAVLTAVGGGGTSADYDEDAGPPDSKWSGRARAYYRTKRERVSRADGSDVIVRRELIVATRDPGVEYSTGDTLTFSVEGEEMTGEVQEIVKRRLPAAGVAETTVLTMEPQ